MGSCLLVWVGALCGIRRTLSLILTLTLTPTLTRFTWPLMKLEGAVQGAVLCKAKLKRACE